MKINSFRGELTDNSAKKGALIALQALLGDAHWCEVVVENFERRWQHRMGTQHCKLKTTRHGPVVLFQPKYRLAHPENYLFSLSKKIFSGSKYPKNILFIFENRSTAGNVHPNSQLTLYRCHDAGNTPIHSRFENSWVVHHCRCSAWSGA